MYLKKLELKNYRNYEYLDLNFGKGTILIIGDNGQGKTNLLESIHYISTGKSHRTSSQDELIGWDSDYSVLRATAGSGMDKKLNNIIEIELRHGNNIKVKVDKIYYRKKTDFASILPSVIFSPDDLKIVKASPSNRRNFLDGILDKIYGDFPGTRLQYQKILTQRNSLIKSIRSTADARGNPTLEAWDDNMVKYGARIIRKRLHLMKELRKKIVEYMEYFFTDSAVEIFYVFSWDRESLTVNNLAESAGEGLEEKFCLKLKENLRKDLSYKTTTVGPHRDDFVILIDGRDIRSFGSQGQQRAASISLKLGELAALKEKLKKDPVLLLDDVLSELDMERKKMLVKIMNNKFQTFITTTNISYLDELDIEFENKFLVKDSKIIAIE